MSEPATDPVTGEIVEIVSRIVEIPPGALAMDADLRVEHGVDSLLGLQIVASIEKRFDISVPNEDLDCYSTVQEISELVHRLRASE